VEQQVRVHDNTVGGLMDYCLQSGRDVNLWRNRGTAEMVVIEIWVCRDLGFALHLAQEARL